MNTSISPVSATSVRVTLGGESVIAPVAEAMEVAGELNARHGGGIPKFEYLNAAGEVMTATPAREPEDCPGCEVQEVPVAGPVASKAFSDWSAPIVDSEAKARIEALHEKMRASGIEVNTSEQFFATGTRMASEGYATQEGRKREHEAAMPLEQAAEELRDRVRKEGREDKEMSAREFANAITVNGKVHVAGHALTEQAIRGLTARLKSPALSYVLGLRDRITAEKALPLEDQNTSAIRADIARLADTLRHEALRSGDTVLTLRTRKSPGDIFAVVSPSYTPADAPEVIDQILRDLPKDAKGTWNYDPSSTAWELRANVFTPTPVLEQAVGEPFEGYASFQARDNGTSRFRGGGGAMMLRCLNASVYVASTAELSRVHRGRVMYDIGMMLQGALAGINTLCEAWGTRRQEVIELPKVDEKLLTLEEAMPGFWRALLTDRRSDLVGVLPGRTETHVKALTRCYEEERRDAAKLVRSDFAQGWTRYVQDFAAPVRREAEVAIGDWLVNSRGKMGCTLREASA